MAYLFRGGLYFKGVDAPSGVTEPERAGGLRLYLSRGQTPALPVGAAFRLGQRAAVGNDGASALHFPVSGVVTAIGNDGEGTYIEVESNGENAVSGAVRKMDKKLSDCGTDEIIEKIASAGIEEPDGVSAAGKLARAVGKAGTCIVNCAESEPYIACDSAAAAASPSEVVNGLKIFLRALGIRRGVIAVSEGDAELYKKLSSLTDKSNLISVAKVSGKYPQGDERLLTYAVTGSMPPPGDDPISLECVIFNVQTCLSVYDAFVSGMPQVTRVVTVAGDAVRKPVNVRVPIGTGFSELVKYAGGLAEEPGITLEGGPLRGVRTHLDGAVKKTTKALLLFKEREEAAGYAVCIRCGRCVSACPERLMPNYIYNAIRNGKNGAAVSFGAENCVGCGLCSYVCPGKAPVAELIALLKTELAGKNDIAREAPAEKNAAEDHE